MKKAPTTKVTKQMCCVSIGYTTYLMPADAGMKVVQLMQQALRCERNYEAQGYMYTVREAPEIELAMVKPSQVRVAPPETDEGDDASTDAVGRGRLANQMRLLK